MVQHPVVFSLVVSRLLIVVRYAAQRGSCVRLVSRKLNQRP